MSLVSFGVGAAKAMKRKHKVVVMMAVWRVLCILIILSLVLRVSPDDVAIAVDFR